MKRLLLQLELAAILPLLVFTAASAVGQDIVHDAEFYISQEQNGEAWAREDKILDKTLADFSKQNSN